MWEFLTELFSSPRRSNTDPRDSREQPRQREALDPKKESSEMAAHEQPHFDIAAYYERQQMELNAKSGVVLQHTPSKRAKLQESLGFYLAIETTWHVCLIAACYRYRPLHRLTQTAAGKRLIHQMYVLMKGEAKAAQQSSTASWTPPSWMRRIAVSQRAMVAASEWFVFNKTIGLALFPSKLMLAKWMSQKYSFYKQQYDSPYLLSTSSCSSTMDDNKTSTSSYNSNRKDEKES